MQLFESRAGTMFGDSGGLIPLGFVQPRNPQTLTLNEVVCSAPQTTNTFPEPSPDRTIINPCGACPPYPQPNPEHAIIRIPSGHNVWRFWWSDPAGICSAPQTPDTYPERGSLFSPANHKHIP